jgi:TPR repeat protein
MKSVSPIVLLLASWSIALTPTFHAHSSKTLEDVQNRAESGDPDAQGLWSINQYLGSFIHGDQELLDEARRLAEESVRLGSPFGQYALAWIYEEGRAIQKDEDKAKELGALAFSGLKERAELGDADAQNLVGRCYLVGRGVEADPLKAADWFRKAAAQGHVEAKHVVSGTMLADAQKEFMLSKVAEGDVSAQYFIAMRYVTGDANFPKNLAEAVRWFRKAASQQDSSYSRDAGTYLSHPEKLHGGTLSDSDKALWKYLVAESQDEFFGGPDTKDVMALSAGKQLVQGRGQSTNLLSQIKEFFFGPSQRLTRILRAAPREDGNLQRYPVRLVFENSLGAEEQQDFEFFRDQFDQWSVTQINP